MKKRQLSVSWIMFIKHIHVVMLADNKDKIKVLFIIKKLYTKTIYVY